MASQSGDFLKKNATAGFDMVSKGVVGKIFGAAMIADIVTSENKLKAVGKALRDIVLMQPLFNVFAIGAFGGMKKAIVSLLHDTGSLEQALKKLGQIQGLQNMFTPLVGGASAAKMKVAELTAFSARFNKSLQETGEAARSLTIMTRGAFASADAMKVIGDAATATGTDMATMADTVGEVFAALRGGESISGAVERLRALGAISQQTGDKLVTLQQNGGGLADVFSATVAALGPLSGSMDGYKDTLAGVNAAHDKALQSLQEKFASPFVADDIQNTKNWTGAMQAVAPSVERVAGVMNFLIGGLSTVSSWLAESLAKWTAFRIAVEVATDAIMVLIAAFALWGSFSLAMWCIEAAGAAATLGTTLVTMAATASTSLIALAGSNVILAGAASMASTAMTWLAATLSPIIVAIAPFLLLAAAVAAVGAGLMILGGMVMSGVKAWNAQEEALKKLKKAHEEVTTAMEKQIKSIKTLQDKHEALTKALQEQADAYNELAAANQKLKDDPTSKSARHQKAEAERNLDDKTRNVENASKVKASDLERTDTQKEISKTRMNRDIMLEEQEYQNKLETRSPRAKAVVMRQRRAEMIDRIATGADAEQARNDAEGQSTEAADRVSKARQEWQQAVRDKYDKTGLTGLSPEQLDANKAAKAAALKQALEDQRQVGKNAPFNSATRTEYELRELNAGRGTMDDGESRTDAIKRNQKKLDFQKKREADYADGKPQGEKVDLEKNLSVLQKEISLNEDLAAMKKQMDDLDSLGYQRTQDEIAIQMAMLDRQMQFEKTKAEGGPDEAKLKELQGQKDKLAKGSKINATTQAYEEGLADTEKQRGEIRETGFERTKKENALTMKDLNSKLAREEAIAKLSKDDTQVKQTKGAIADQKLKEQDALRENVRGNVKSEHEAELQKAQISGNVKRATTIGDVGVYEAKRSELEGQGKTRKEADAQAKEFGMNAITLEARKEGGQMNSAVAATDLARIGGGGNIASGDDAIDIAKRQLDYLAEIAANVKREPDTGEGGTPLH